MVVCRCLCPSTRNCGSSTSLEMPTDCRPEFHLYRISRIVYPTWPCVVAHARTHIMGAAGLPGRNTEFVGRLAIFSVVVVVVVEEARVHKNTENKKKNSLL